MAEFQFAQPNFYGMLSGLGDTFSQGMRQRRIADTFSGFNGDYQEAANKLLQMGYVKEAAAIAGIGQDQLLAASLANSRAAGAVPDEVKLWGLWNKQYGPGGGSAQPSFLAPPEGASSSAPSGVPGVNFAQASGADNAPAFLQQKFLSLKDQERIKEEGQGEGERNAQMARMPAMEAGIARVLGDLWGEMEGFDDTTISNALGPLQGGGATTLDQIRSFVPQQLGAALNAIPFIGGEKSTDEVRGAITGSVEAVGALLKPFVKLKGDPWTDQDQARLIAIVGDLQRSKNRAEFDRRLRRAVSRINSAWGLNIDVNSVIPPKEQTQLPEAPPMDMAVDPPPGVRRVPTVSIDPATGAEMPTAKAAVSGAIRDPHGPYLGKSNLPKVQKGSDEERQLMQWANDAIRQGADPKAVLSRLRDMGIEQ